MRIAPPAVNHRSVSASYFMILLQDFNAFLQLRELCFTSPNFLLLGHLASCVQSFWTRHDVDMTATHNAQSLYIGQ